ncbi:MAG TPA: hypothetical protein VFD30_17470 [Terriglobia bacterium]|nr:hypothetical protein [Terriglobia bacterium]
MKNDYLALHAVLAGLALACGISAGPSLAQNTPSPAARAVGVVTQVQRSQLVLRTDSGPEVQVQLSEGTTVLRVPPGAKDLKAATKISSGEISPGDRLLVRGHFSDDQKTLVATSVVVMTKSDLGKAHEAEVLEWQRRGIGGVVKAIDPSKKEITIAVPNAAPTPGNPTHQVILTLEPNAMLLRYAPDSVKFSDAKPSTFDAIKTGDQVRALGTKSEDGSRFAAEKVVFGTFRNIGATVISVEPSAGTVTVKDLSTGKPLIVRAAPDCKLRQLPPDLAQMIARFNSGGSPRSAAAGGPPSGPRQMPDKSSSGPGGPPRDIQQMLDHLPTLSLSALKAGEPLIVVSTEGTKPSEVTAITILTGVEPILAARPSGSTEMNLGPWNMSTSGGEGTQ